VVLLGLICAQFGIFVADSIAALIVAIIVIYVSYTLGKRSINVLLDKVPYGIFQKTSEILDNIPEIENYHDLKVRASGADVFIEVNIHVSSNLDVIRAHNIASMIENKIRKELPRSYPHVHIEPDSHT